MSLSVATRALAARCGPSGASRRLSTAASANVRASISQQPARKFLSGGVCRCVLDPPLFNHAALRFAYTRKPHCAKRLACGLHPRCRLRKRGTSYEVLKLIVCYADDSKVLTQRSLKQRVAVSASRRALSCSASSV